ncbi:MAG: LapA family protein [Bradyrhizobium sp.]
MRKFLRTVLLVLLAVIIVDFSLANRHFVTVSFDPFASGDSAFDLPPQRLFVVIIAALILGVLVGGSATWFRQGRWRRAARQHEADAREMRTQLADWRARAAMSQRQDQTSPAMVPQVGYRRDKQGATL